MRHLTLGLVLAMVLFAGTAAHAETIPISLVLTVDEVTTVFEDLAGTLSPEGIFRGEGELDGVGFEAEWDVQGNLDPVLTVGISVTDTGAPSVFSFVFGLPAGSIPSPTVTGGSIGGSLTDGSGNGATLSSSGQPIYTALVNGLPFQTLLNSPYSLSATDPFSTVSIPVESFGIPGLTFPGPGVTVTDMGIEIRFALSGGDDSVAMTANFVLEPTVIPEPASVALMGFGLAAMSGTALRRRLRRG